MGKYTCRIIAMMKSEFSNSKRKSTRKQWYFRWVFDLKDRLECRICLHDIYEGNGNYSAMLSPPLYKAYSTKRSWQVLCDSMPVLCDLLIHSRLSVTRVSNLLLANMVSTYFQRSVMQTAVLHMLDLTCGFLLWIGYKECCMRIKWWADGSFFQQPRSPPSEVI